MRRFVIYILIILVAIFAFTRIVNRSKKGKKTKDAPRTYSEIFFKKAMELKSGSPEQAREKFENILDKFPQSKPAQKSLLEIADIYIKQNKLLAAKTALKRLVEDYPAGPFLAVGQERLWGLNIKILFSPIKTENSMVYEVKGGDTLYKIAKKFHTTVDLLMKSNGISGSLIKPNQKLKIVKAVFKIDVSKSKNILTLKTDDEIIKVYSVATGKDNSTPSGKFKILSGHRIIDPVWYKTGAKVPAGSPENILGTRWLGLSEPGYGIHGTVDPGSIGKQSTQGCIRMRNEDVEEFFIIIPGETEVVIND